MLWLKILSKLSWIERKRLLITQLRWWLWTNLIDLRWPSVHITWNKNVFSCEQLQSLQLSETDSNWLDDATRIKLWIDDLRDAPDDTWVIARTSKQALALLDGEPWRAREISFDHDLGGDDTTRPVAAMIEEWAHYNGNLNGSNGRYAVVTRIHSANPVGKEWLKAALKYSTQYQER